MDPHTFGQRMHKIKTTDHENAAWGHSLQLFCEDFWRSIGQAAEHDASHCEALQSVANFQDQVSDFVTLLEDPNAYVLASYVIPALRSSCEHDPEFQSMSLVQRSVHERLSTVRHACSPTRPTETATSDKLYDEEKAILREVELYRACLLLRHTGTPPIPEAAQIRQWLAQAP